MTTGLSIPSCVHVDARSSANIRTVYRSEGGGAFAMAAKVHGDHPMSSAEARDLLIPITPITRRAVHEHEGRVTSSGVVVRQHNIITDQIHHR